MNLDVIDGLVRIRPYAEVRPVRLEPDRAGGQIKRLAERLSRSERIGVERDPHPPGLVEVAHVIEGIVLGEQQKQVAVLDGVNAGSNVPVADGHYPGGVLRRGGPDNVVSAHPFD